MQKTLQMKYFASKFCNDVAFENPRAHYHYHHNIIYFVHVIMQLCSNSLNLTDYDANSINDFLKNYCLFAFQNRVLCVSLLKESIQS